MNNSLFVTAASASADALRRFLRLDAPGRQHEPQPQPQPEPQPQPQPQPEP